MKKRTIITNPQTEITKKELLENLDRLGVKEAEYSLDGDFNSDTIVLWHNHYKWDIFYMDERGNRNLLKTVYSEDEAYNCIYKIFEEVKS